jgi:hypothetical protein
MTTYPLGVALRRDGISGIIPLLGLGHDLGHMYWEALHYSD